MCDFPCRELYSLCRNCVVGGEKNSVLLIGPRGSGKSLVRDMIAELG